MGILDRAFGPGRHHVKSSTTAKRQLASVQEAEEAFERGVRRLLDVNHWSRLSGLDQARFVLYDATGRRAYRMHAEPGDFVAIALPVAGIMRTDWVRIEAARVTPTSATLVLRPSHDPTRRPTMPAVTAHFFTREATNRFRLERRGPWLIARVEGRDESANVGEECGGTQLALINRVLAEGGWGLLPTASPQARQWERFTRRLIGLRGSS